MKLIAMADMDSDGYADLITLNNDEDAFTVHFYHPEHKTYELITWPIQVEPDSNSAVITNIVASKNMQQL